MKTVITTLIFSLLSSVITAQDIKGVVEYTIKLAEDNFPFIGTLYFNERSSTFITKQSNEAVRKLKKHEPGQEYLTEEIYSDTIGHTIVTHLGNPQLKVRDFYEPSMPVLYEDAVSIRWNVKKEKKEIEGLLCQKATANFRGRRYEVWFSTTIPAPFGPWKFHGLPGLIIELKDSKKEVSINLVRLSFKGDDKKIYTSNGSEGKIKMSDFYACVEREWKKSGEQTKARFARLRAEHPGLEIELETLKKRPATESKFE